MARKTKLTDYTIENARECIRLGMTYSATCSALSISENTFQNWMNWGRSGIKDPMYSKFYAAIKESEADLMKDCLQKIKISADTGNIETVKWLLERKFFEFSKQSQVNVKAQQENLNINLNAQVTEDDKTKIRNEILAKLRPKSNLLEQLNEIS